MFSFFLSDLLQDHIQKPDAGVTALIISSVIAAIGLLVLFLTNRFIKSYDNSIKGLHARCNSIENLIHQKQTESIDRDNKIHDRIDEAFAEINSIKDDIAKNIAERERQIAAVDRKAYESQIITMQNFEKINISLEVMKERILKINS